MLVPVLVRFPLVQHELVRVGGQFGVSHGFFLTASLTVVKGCLSAKAIFTNRPVTALRKRDLPTG